MLRYVRASFGTISSACWKATAASGKRRNW
jgi:hypothetical protein